MESKKTNIVDFLWLVGSFLFIRLNLTERGNNKISLSNLMVLVCIVKVAMAPVISITEIGALFLSVLNYAHKRFEANKAAHEEQSKLPDSKTIIEEMKGLKSQLEEQAKQLESQGKVVEEAKSMLTATKISSSQKRTQL